MAAADPEKNIKDQFSCSICLDLFKDPVSPDCGHSFCKECITQHCKEEGIDIACPLCKKMFQKRSLRPNWELKKIMESLPQMSYLANELTVGNICQKHQEPLNLYCKEDDTPICVTCERTKSHQTHDVIPLKTATQEHRKTATERLETIKSNFEQLHQFVNKVWKNLPQDAQEEEHERLNALIDKAVTHFKAEAESTRRRFGDSASQTQLPDSQLTSSCPEGKIAVETELDGQKDKETISEETSKNQKTESHVIHICEEAPTPKYGLDHASLDPSVHVISSTTKDDDHKVDMKSHSRRPEDLPSPIPSVESGGRKEDNISPGENVVVQTELQDCEGACNVPDKKVSSWMTKSPDEDFLNKSQELILQAQHTKESDSMVQTGEEKGQPLNSGKRKRTHKGPPTEEDVKSPRNRTSENQAELERLKSNMNLQLEKMSRFYSSVFCFQLCVLFLILVIFKMIIS